MTVPDSLYLLSWCGLVKFKSQSVGLQLGGSGFKSTWDLEAHWMPFSQSYLQANVPWKITVRISFLWGEGFLEKMCLIGAKIKGFIHWLILLKRLYSAFPCGSANPTPLSPHPLKNCLLLRPPQTTRPCRASRRSPRKILPSPSQGAKSTEPEPWWKRPRPW